MNIDKFIFTEKELPQKSEDWKKKRREWGVGTSEISIIRGKFPKIWCDDYELFLRKMGKPYEIDNKYIETGNRDEEKARKFIQEYLKNGANSEFIYDRTGGFEIDEPNFEQYTIQYKHFPSIYASYDGIDIKNKLVLELKCPSKQTFTKILKNRKPTIPKMYFDQTQGQLMIAESHFEITEGIFGVYYDEGVILKDKKTKNEKLVKAILIKSDLDPEYCTEMEIECKKFCEMIKNRQWKKNWKS